MEFEKDIDNKLEMGKVMLTKIGRELAPICVSSPGPDSLIIFATSRKKRDTSKKKKKLSKTVYQTVNYHHLSTMSF